MTWSGAVSLHGRGELVAAGEETSRDRLGEARGGDLSDAAFETLVARYQTRVFRLVCGILGPEFVTDAEDGTQEIFLLAYRKMKSFRAESRFATWLYRLARNRAIDYRRHLCRASALATGSDWDPEVVPARSATPYRSAQRRERARLLSAKLAQLSESQQTAIRLHYWLGCSIEEIAELMNSRPATVKSHLFRARRKLARTIEEAAR
jgi:RNA polymerase sigma-70 factor (ECF subfamily)